MSNGSELLKRLGLRHLSEFIGGILEIKATYYFPEAPEAYVHKRTKLNLVLPVCGIKIVDHKERAKDTPEWRSNHDDPRMELLVHPVKIPATEPEVCPEDHTVIAVECSDAGTHTFWRFIFADDGEACILTPDLPSDYANPDTQDQATEQGTVALGGSVKFIPRR